MLRRTMIGAALLLALAGIARAQQDLGTLGVAQQIEILKGLVRQQTAAMGPNDKAQVKAALLELANEL